MWTNVCAALADNELLDLGAAHRTRLALATINSKMILKIAAAIDPVYAGAVAADAFLKDSLDGLVQSFSLFAGYRIRKDQRVEFCHVQGFVAIDITQTGEKGLIEQ